MGRVRPSSIKNLVWELVELYADKFTDDFEKNKKVVDEISEVKSKSVRNKIAGYITHIVQIEKRKSQAAE
ncbi:MAG: 30S ribosomal protein S17e [Candidatus Odinarchaeum yellowstonii]|uniref:Small ribosomal subunit protein eS17 n=1 Tax=Odinarchaeota yellowstonii (strain LCB_4) TaxID=1841599 RepID=A0AAF0D3B6_ODILC|nr:MAG: 30S ribosomal protein S17e [Candidatus Odinarchaeum yellowstonii]